MLEERGSAGSGVHIEDDGEYAIFVTNRHVVDAPSNAREIEYMMKIKDKKVPYEVIAFGRYELDLAKLRVGKCRDVGHDVHLNIATLEQLKPGQQCVAIGNALGAGISITAGVISAFDDFEAGKYIRTDAAISSGNSGGGLFRKKDGCLIGITTLASRSSSTTAIQNINLAIPMDYIKSTFLGQAFPVNNSTPSCTRLLNRSEHPHRCHWAALSLALRRCWTGHVPTSKSVGSASREEGSQLRVISTLIMGVLLTALFYTCLVLVQQKWPETH